MNMNGISGVNAQAGLPGINQTADPYSKSIQKQIADTQKQLQELSSNEELSMEEKMKKRQELQQQISNLNMQLRQHQIEQRRAAGSGSGKKQDNGSDIESMLGGNRKTGSAKTGAQGAGLSQAGMKAMISADAAVDQARIQGSVATRMEGRAGVLRAEIKQDAALGGNTQAKEEELVKAEQIAMNAESSQINTLENANKELEEAARAESKAEKTEKKEKTEETDEADKSRNENMYKTSDTEEKREDEISTEADYEPSGQQPAIYYTPVDVRL